MDLKSLAFNKGILPFAPLFCEQSFFQQTLPRPIHPTFHQREPTTVSRAVLRAATEKHLEVLVQ